MFHRAYDTAATGLFGLRCQGRTNFTAFGRALDLNRPQFRRSLPKGAQRLSVLPAQSLVGGIFWILGTEPRMKDSIMYFPSTLPDALERQISDRTAVSDSSQGRLEGLIIYLICSHQSNPVNQLNMASVSYGRRRSIG